MTHLFDTRKRVLSVLIAALLVGAGGGAAIAYFSTSGTGHGHVVVGTASNLAVTLQPYTAPSGLMVPDLYVEHIAYSITNTGGSQAVTSITAYLEQDASGDVLDVASNTYVLGCQASWFTVTNHPPTLPVTLASGGVANGNLDVQLDNWPVNQDACQGISPQVNVTAS